MLAFHSLDGSAAQPLSWRPNHGPHTPESQPQFAHPPESQPQFAHPPESQPQFAHPPESQPRFIPKSAHAFGAASEAAPGRRAVYRRTSPPSYPRTYKPRQLRQESSTAATVGGPRHAFFKSFYPEPAPTAPPAPTTGPASTTTPEPAALPDVHVVAMSVSTSVKKGSEEAPASSADSPDDSPGSASVIHPVLVPPSGDPVRFQPDWAPQQTTQSLPPPPPPPALPKVYGVPEENYEVDEAVSVLTNGRAHGKQPTRPAPAAPPAPPAPPAPTPPLQQQQQHADGTAKPSPSGYVVEGRNYRKYRVEEKTPDGFIVGEYGVVSHQDGSLRGVRYTADSTINPRLIYDALVKFLSL
ncbi:hypothetical protein ONE63_002728 [Megalurothrips usitatus]|uniref:Uncharacterized protein n=1 Tax=Megalurothrips usitatus TaxID=439358 RepID=A0AAV7XBP1_9NEOP|nr:hypothetical protein ONE63_002728 [Megalurothrips usitatus]